MLAVDLARLAIGTVFLGYAAVADWRTRVVRDRVWIGMGTLGLGLFAIDLATAGVEPLTYLVLVPTAVLFYGVYGGKEFFTESGEFQFPPVTVAAYLIALVAAVYPIFAFNQAGDATGLRTYLTYLGSPVMMVVLLAMYQAHLLKGGADAKGLIAVAALVPVYPALGTPFPLVALGARLTDAMAVVFPFSLLVLLNAALLMVFLPLAFLIVNAAHRHVELPEALVGYKVALDKVPPFVWFMDGIEEGKRVVTYFPRKSQDRKAIAQALRDAGLKEAWVTPQLPFIVPVAVSFVFSFLVGNVLMGLLQLGLPAP